MIADDTRTNLMAIANAYAAATGLSLATLSRKFHGKQSFFINFGTGRCSITVSKLAEVLQLFSDAWPVGLPWPETKPLSMRRPPRSPERPRKKPVDNSSFAG